MSTPNRGRLVRFFSVLIVAAVLLLVVSAVLDVNPIVLAPLYMFSPLIAGLLVCWH